MTVLRSDRAVHEIQESLSQPREKSVSQVREPRRTVNVQTANRPIHRPINNVYSDKTTTKPTTKKLIDYDLLIEAEIEEMNMSNDNVVHQLAKHPASVLRQAADLSEAAEREMDSAFEEEVTEADLEAQRARIFGRETFGRVKTGDPFVAAYGGDAELAESMGRAFTRPQTKATTEQKTTTEADAGQVTDDELDQLQARIFGRVTT